ncbi:MAG: putative virulence factor [Candidatus Azobacteroides sp.]|nr:putative virulence factor [Candidatus Azobacteroides sp.]
MEKNIQKQLEIIERANTWNKNSLEGNKAKEFYRNMVNCRRMLNREKFALEGNPAAAIYGESQVGKSYLVSSLLSEEGKPFNIKDENGSEHNFIEKINPPGGGSESTSLVSRFSVSYKPVNQKFPIKAVLLSPADIVLVLCDSFYNDINLKTSQNIHFLSTDEINTEVFQTKDKLKDRKVQQTVFVEDDVLDMQDYFNEYFQKADKVIDSKFFDEISLLISKARPDEWSDIFSLLWNRNEIFTNLLGELIDKYQKLNFAKEVYLPMESVLYAYGTLLDVKRLHEIYAEPDDIIEPNYTAITKLLLPQSNQEIEFAKSYLCALTAELVFSQSETLLNSKPFLKETDLLDFPGARSRMEKPLEAIENETIPDLLLRGKVAYLFNKYSDAEKINILIFCAKHEQTAQRIMPRLLNNWVNKIVGDTAEKREAFVAKSKIPPLFVIGTFFNINLAYNPLQDKSDGTGTPLSNRWLQRFTTTLEKECFEKVTYSWFENWAKSQPDFQNIFLLRDFEKSETPSNLFKGFNTNKKELVEVSTPQYPNFRQDLRQSFLDYDFVKRHFANPAESWDEAAAINKDGTKLIIDKLTIAADNINPARMAKMRIELNGIFQTIINELLKHFHSNDKDEELEKAKNTAGDIQVKLATAFSADKIKNYGHLMREFMLDEGSVLELFRKKVNDLEHRDVENKDKYSIFRMEVPIEKDDTVEKYFERLCARYEKKTEERIKEFRDELEAKQIDLEVLIRGNTDLIKNNAQQLAEALLEYWFEYIALNDKIFIQQILGQDASLDNIKDMYQKLLKKLGIAKRIAEKIRRYVDGHSKTDLPYEIVADISAELLNKCINTVGFEYLDESEIDDLQQANEKNNLCLILDNNTNPTESSVEELFTKIENQTEIMTEHPEEMKSLPSFRNYLAWSNRLKVGFVSVCDIPNYNLEANAKLGKIIDECRTINYG